MKILVEIQDGATRQKPMKRFVDVRRGNMQIVGATEKGAKVMERLRNII